MDRGVLKIVELVKHYNIVIMKGMIQSIQKVIKVGSSAAVTIPAKELKMEDIAVGEVVRVTVERVKQSGDSELGDDYKKFVQQYGETLKNLAHR